MVGQSVCGRPKRRPHNKRTSLAPAPFDDRIECSLAAFIGFDDFLAQACGIRHAHIEGVFESQAGARQAAQPQAPGRAFEVVRRCQRCGVVVARHRLFECRQYQQVASGEISYESAARRIAGVKEQVARISLLLVTATGGGNLRKPLAQRYATALELSAAAGEPSGLTEDMRDLQAKLDENFRPWDS